MYDLMYVTDSVLKCYYCEEISGNCNAENYGKLVQCQMKNPLEPHYGDYCSVGHTGEK